MSSLFADADTNASAFNAAATIVNTVAVAIINGGCDCGNGGCFDILSIFYVVNFKTVSINSSGNGIGNGSSGINGNSTSISTSKRTDHSGGRGGRGTGSSTSSTSGRKRRSRRNREIEAFHSHL
ncbi:hypothetical protein ABW20_dc0100343 [Dactylellina cionopaga]|nr:hypothetical protein ABW20_dc0100343 [Dactylellina cionopaga]